MRRSGFKDGLELSLTVRIILLCVGIALFIVGVAVLERIIILGLIMLGLGVLLAFIGMESGVSIMHVRRGARDPRKSATRKKGGYQRESGYPWDQMGKGER